ncbi:MAG: mtDNA inheritance, partitioning of the mitochondrial organelle [Caeruleum heppii]|nr:MAG: mtDNA inheritance, partitioning of the mitochondrial organelle [Caeruleum heppii]
MHEIVTLQLGHRSNHLATHFWNTQESYFTYAANEESPVDHDIHFRPGIGADGADTFTPRTVIYDLKGGFGSLKKVNALYESRASASDTMPQGVWDGPTALQKQMQIEESLYVRSLNEGVQPPRLSSETVRYWSDFNRLFYHPRSIIQLDEYELNSSLTPFETWQTGEELFDSLDREHDLLDRDLRPFIEECDQMQGLQVIADVDNAWGGFTGRYMDRLCDEYGKNSIWIWGLEDGQRGNQVKQRSKMVNTARAYQSIAAKSSVYIPMLDPPRTPGRLSLNRSSEWHTSALLSGAMESVTLPSRMRPIGGQRSTYSEMEGTLDTTGRQRIATLHLSKLDSEAPGNRGEPSSPPLDRRLPNQEHVGIQGSIDEGNEVQETSACLTRPEMDLSLDPGNMTLKPRTKTRRDFGQVNVLRARYHTALEFPLLDSYPTIWPETGDSDTIAVQAVLSTSSDMADRLRVLATTVGRAIGVEERETLKNDLGEMAEGYREGWDSGSDADTDDD